MCCFRIHRHLVVQKRLWLTKPSHGSDLGWWKWFPGNKAPREVLRWLTFKLTASGCEYLHHNGEVSKSSLHRECQGEHLFSAVNFKVKPKWNSADVRLNDLTGSTPNKHLSLHIKNNWFFKQSNICASVNWQLHQPGSLKFEKQCFQIQLRWLSKLKHARRPFIRWILVRANWNPGICSQSYLMQTCQHSWRQNRHDDGAMHNTGATGTQRIKRFFNSTSWLEVCFMVHFCFLSSRQDKSCGWTFKWRFPSCWRINLRYRNICHQIDPYLSLISCSYSAAHFFCKAKLKRVSTPQNTSRLLEVVVAIQAEISACMNSRVDPVCVNDGRKCHSPTRPTFARGGCQKKQKQNTIRPTKTQKPRLLRVSILCFWFASEISSNHSYFCVDWDFEKADTLQRVAGVHLLDEL